ncbi:MAG: ergothioneine biosynthesis protein EgtB [Beijerinckiaceae bacterium]
MTAHTVLERQSGAIPAAEKTLHERLAATREMSLALASSLSAEDQTVQAMDDASPTKWHLAHTTWFFETFLLSKYLSGYRVFDESFHYCFNSYYEAEGPRHPRPFRGLLTRPSQQQVLDYRAHVDEGLERLAAAGAFERGPAAELAELGINHEQQHQELLLTDILALFARNPLRPAYAGSASSAAPEERHELQWIGFDGGIREAGHRGDGFCFDNETPRHEVLLRRYRLASAAVTNAQWREFMADGGYENAALWLSDGWAVVRAEGWRAPLYWEEQDGHWLQMSLHGLVEPDPHAPVCHVSYYEADAFARWAGKRLPSEFEWENAAASSNAAAQGNTLASGALKPMPAPAGGGLQQMMGDVWEWTASAYLPYPGFRPPQGAVGEYNGKFMVNQHILRGASCATAGDHSRHSYRNFFYPHQRWQFMGLRLADDGQ